MNYFLKKTALALLDVLRPIFSRLTARAPLWMAELKTNFSDYYLSGMVSHFNFLHERIFKPSFLRVHTDTAEVARLQDLAREGTLVYVMKTRGQLEYSFFNHLFLKEGIPLARFANGSRTFYWRPFNEMFRAVVARLQSYYDNGLLADPIQSGYLEELVTRGESALINLKVSREFLFGATEDPLEFIPPLLRAAEKSDKPVYLVTQQFLYDRHPEKVHKSWSDLLFGEKSNPGPLRKLILFFMMYGKKATVKFGEPLELKTFIAENPGADAKTIAANLKTYLLARLMIERKSITGPPLLSREKILDRLLRSKTFKNQIEALSQELRRDKKELQKSAIRYFDELAADVNYTYIDLYDRLIRWMTHSIYDGLDIDPASIARIKAVAGKHPLVLVPAHKSHIDYLLLSYIFYNYDLTLPHICAGINLKFWPADRFIRKAGGFFIRRTFEGDKLYKIVVENYVKILVKEGFTLEFFIEGTRSRTGKMLKPRMGVLSMIMRAFFDGAASDIYFVPISINYERILEEKSHVEEIHGSSKKKEGLAELLGVRKKFRRKYGRVFIRFAEPVSLKKFLLEKGFSRENDTEPGRRRLVEKFAFHLTHDINRISIITSTSLVAMSLLTLAKKGLPDLEVRTRVKLLESYLDYKGAELTGAIRQKGEKAYTEALEKLVAEKAIAVHEDFTERFYTLDENKRTWLDMHKNNAVHFFVSLACFSKIIQKMPGDSLALADLRVHFESLKTLLRHDFTFNERIDINEHLKKIAGFYAGLGLIDLDETTDVLHVGPARRDPRTALYASLADNFFESLLLTLLYIKHVSFLHAEGPALEKAILEKGRVLLLKGDLTFPESLSHFNVRNALAVFADLGLLVKEGRRFKRVFEAETIARWEKLLRTLLNPAAFLESTPFPQHLPKSEDASPVH